MAGRVGLGASVAYPSVDTVELFLVMSMGYTMYH